MLETLIASVSADERRKRHEAEAVKIADACKREVIRLADLQAEAKSAAETQLARLRAEHDAAELLVHDKWSASGRRERYRDLAAKVVLGDYQASDIEALFAEVTAQDESGQRELRGYEAPKMLLRAFAEARMARDPKAWGVFHSVFVGGPYPSMYAGPCLTVATAAHAALGLDSITAKREAVRALELIVLRASHGMGAPQDDDAKAELELLLASSSVWHFEHRHRLLMAERKARNEQEAQLANEVAVRVAEGTVREDDDPGLVQRAWQNLKRLAGVERILAGGEIVTPANNPPDLKKAFPKFAEQFTPLESAETDRTGPELVSGATKPLSTPATPIRVAPQAAPSKTGNVALADHFDMQRGADAFVRQAR